MRDATELLFLNAVRLRSAIDWQISTVNKLERKQDRFSQTCMHQLVKLGVRYVNDALL
jgi:hypothetical protein